MLKYHIGHFPTLDDFYKLGMADLFMAVDERGGIDKYRVLLGDDPIVIPTSYWTEDAVLRDLKLETSRLGHFPKLSEITANNKFDLHAAIYNQGGISKFKALLGVEIKNKPWTPERIIDEIGAIIEEIGYYPTTYELQKMGRTGLVTAINKNGGVNIFREVFNADPSYFRRARHWTHEQIVTDLNAIIQRTGIFPSSYGLTMGGRVDLYNAMTQNGGIDKYRELLGYTKKENRWNEEVIIAELKAILTNRDTFPTLSELIVMNRGDLTNAISKYGGINKFRVLFGYPQSTRGMNRMKNRVKDTI